MEESTDVQAPEITLEDFDGEQETPKAEPSSVEAEKPAKEEAKAEPEAEKTPETEPKEEAKAEPEAKETEDEAEAEVAETDKPSGELAPKSENRFQKLANENRDLRAEVEKLTSETYAPQSVQELTQTVNPETGEPYTVAQAADVALSQQWQMRDYTTRAANAQSLLGTEAYEVMQELPIFNPDSEHFDKELAAIAAETLEANLIRDPNIPEINPETGEPTGLGMIVDYRQTPKQIYKTLARASGLSTIRGQLKGQQDTEQMLANADTASSASPGKVAKDPILALWEEDDK